MNIFILGIHTGTNGKLGIGDLLLKVHNMARNIAQNETQCQCEKLPLFKVYGKFKISLRNIDLKCQTAKR